MAFKLLLFVRRRRRRRVSVDMFVCYFHSLHFDGKITLSMAVNRGNVACTVSILSRRELAKK